VKTYFFKILATALSVVILNIIVLLTVRAPVSAEYWVREVILVKRHLATTFASPKIVLLGGSSTLFDIDAVAVQNSLHLPCLNEGLHAGLRLEDLLAEARIVSKSGDILVLILEPSYYQEDTEWNDWQLRNRLAWDSRRFDALPLFQRLRILGESSTPSLACELLSADIGQHFFPQTFQPRLQALEGSDEIIARFLANEDRATIFSYSVENLDSHGDMMNTRRAKGAIEFEGAAAPLTIPGAISSHTAQLLQSFILEMRARQIHIFFAHTPYLLDGSPDIAWEKSEQIFQENLQAVGGELIDQRSELFFPRTLFFNSPYHLNAQGRDLRTSIFIRDLRQKLTR